MRLKQWGKGKYKWMRAINFFPGENKHKQTRGGDRPQPQHFSLREPCISENTVATREK